MSTRATYMFEGNYYSPVTIYIHHDGYPSGAAQYFQAALDVKPQRAQLPVNFLIANDRAELTDSHECHGDTEFRYTVERKGTLLVEARIELDQWEVLDRFKSVEQFIEMADQVASVHA